MTYNHTQIGRLMIFVLFAVAILFGGILIKNGFDPAFFAFILFILFLLASFASLNVIINKEYLQIKFGYGIYKKRFLLKNITSAKAVKNHWYFGWGIRYWVPSRMLIFNVSGFDAVEIRTKDNKIYRIGTDEPQNLKQAILLAIRTDAPPGLSRGASITS